MHDVDDTPDTDSAGSKKYIRGFQQKKKNNAITVVVFIILFKVIDYNL